MIGNLARKRTALNLPRRIAAAALAAALLGAMFAAGAPARAAEGDVTSNTGVCLSTANTQGVTVHPAFTDFGSSIAVNVSVGGAAHTVTCPAEHAGYRVSITPNGTAQPTIKRLEPELTIELAEPVVTTAGGDFTVVLRFKNLVQFTNDVGVRVGSRAVMPNTSLVPPSTPATALQGGSEVRYDFGRVSGEVPDLERPLNQPGNWVDSGMPLSLVVPRGTSPGEYIISAQISYDEFVHANRNNTSELKSLRARATLTVSDEPISGLDAVTLSLADTAEDNPLTSADETVAGTGTAAAAGGSVWLKLESRNSLGHPARSTALSSASAFGLGANLAFYSGGRGDAVTAMPQATSVSTNEVSSTMYLEVTKTDGRPGMVDVNAVVIGPGNVIETEALTLNFTGAPAVAVLGDGASVGQPAAGAEAQTEIALSAVDAAGNSVPPGSVMYRITDADGAAVSGAAIRPETSTAGASTPTIRDDSNAGVVLLTVSDAVEPGVYTLTASLPGVDDSADTATLTVTGPPASIALSAEPTTSGMVGAVITVTAAVMDADGNSVADGLDVTFTSSGTSLVAIGTDASEAAGRQAKTVGGAATAQYTVIGGGTTVISGAIGGQTSVVLVTSTVGDPAVAAAEAEAQRTTPLLTDLSGTRGLVSYFGPDTTARTLLRLVAGRANAIWLSTEAGGWKLYATVHGAPVPGSENFDVTHGDVLYLSK